MQLKVSGSLPMSVIKKDFSIIYPFLKLEFFENPHKSKEPSSKVEMITGDPLLSDISGFSKDGEINADPETTVSKLEATFRTDFGLYVQVFRKSGRVWLETSATDGLTLMAQNELGKEKATPVEGTDLTEIDYD